MKNIKGIVIDAGHGGEDPGAVGNGLVEKDLNLKVANYLYNRFNELGVPVKLTRNKDETLNSTERVKRILNAYGDDPNVLVLSNHINAGGGDGAEVVYALRNTNELAEKVLNAIGSEGQNIREVYQRRLPTDPSKDYYFIHRETGKTEPILIEYGFLDSKGDDVKQLNEDLLDYAEAVVRGVSEYGGIKYVPPVGTNTYVVQKGDSLWSIANKFNTSVDKLKELNNLTINLLNVGQILKISEQEEVPEETFTYIVKKGDSLWKISQEYGVNVDDLIKLNNLNNTSLSIGQKLIIPGTKPEEPKEESNTYIVQAGDSLWNLAKKFNTSVDELKNQNNLTSNLLSIGQKLIIPTKEAKTYTVQKGDSLWKIANENNVTVDELKKINNLTTNNLSIGQKLIIP